MDNKLQSIKEPLKKALEYISSNRVELSKYHTRLRNIDDKLTTENIADAAGDHLFDDYPEMFGITKMEGHTIREFFQDPKYKFVSELHKEFPDYFGNEREEFLELINASQKEPQKMKLAIIDQNVLSAIRYDMPDFLREELAKRGIEADVSANYHLFQDFYKNFDTYQGVLLHLGVDNQSEMKDILEQNKNKPIALLSYQPEDYEFDIPVFDYFSASAIKKWLENSK